MFTSFSYWFLSLNTAVGTLGLSSDAGSQASGAGASHLVALLLQARATGNSQDSLRNQQFLEQY